MQAGLTSHDWMS